MKYDKAFNEKNAAALASLFTEDALLVAPEGLFSGRGAIEKRYADVFRRSHLSDFFGMRNQLNAIGNELCAVGEWWALLAVARSLPSPQGAIVEWREGDAGALPFAEALFDVAFCQLGLQYFPDRSQALCEMHRVLKSSGRLVALVWRALVHSPGFAALAKALERHVSPAARAVMQAPFVFWGCDRGTPHTALGGGLPYCAHTLRCANGSLCITRGLRAPSSGGITLG